MAKANLISPVHLLAFMQLSLTRPSQRPYGMYAIFLFGYLVMSCLIFEQGRTIESQKLLIRSLFFDSSELTAMKLQQQARHRAP